MNKLEDYFYNRSEKTIHKWHHYFDIYDKHFSKFVGNAPKILEIGVYGGGSLLMWKDYFGEDSTIVGLDVNPECKKHEDLSKNVHVYIGDQFNVNSIKQLKQIYNGFDIIIDDGSHINEHQKFTFTQLWDIIEDNGVYLVEDTHTSYWSNYNGGLRHGNSFIEFSKNIIDSVNGYHCNNIDQYTKTINCISYYDSIVVFDKKIINQPPIHTKRFNGKQV